MFQPRRTTCLALILFLSGSGIQAREEPSFTVWDEVAATRFKDAHVSFSRLTGREARLGEAVTLLQLQPKTAVRIEQATTLLMQLVAGSEDDECGILARYYLGRIEHIHRPTPDIPAAIKHYRTLQERHPGHPIAELATVKLAIIELHTHDVGERRRAYTRYEVIARDLKTAPARRDLELLLGDTALRFRLGDESALAHYLAADAAGLSLASVRANTWVAIGELARSSGRNDVATAYYNRFLSEFQHDNRRLLVARHLAGLSVTVAAAAAP